MYGYAARQALGSLPDVSAEYWFVHRDAGQRIGLPLTPAVEAAFLDALAVIVDGMRRRALSASAARGRRAGSGRVPCGYCDPDALGADEHRERWERKRTDPRLAGYVALHRGGPRERSADDAARRLIAGELGETLFVEAGAGSGKTTVSGATGWSRWCSTTVCRCAGSPR